MRLLLERKRREQHQFGRTAQPRGPLLRRRLLFITVYLLYLAVLLVLGLKLYWKFEYDVPVTRNPNPDDVWRYYYGELWQTGALTDSPSADDESHDVLLLGASVLEQVSGLLEEKLRDRLQRPVRVYDLSKSAHTSRDSSLKYSRIADRPFDLIVIYHGINDVRMNCCPPEMFRDDYTHCAWYDSFQERIQAGGLSLPDVSLTESESETIPLGEPDPDLLDEGRTIKTGPAFRGNIGQIVAAAAERQIPVLLMSFAYHIPDGYSRRRFEKAKLDYGEGSYRLPAEIWGYPEAVRAGIDAHNRAITNLAEEYDNVLFVDQHALLQGNPTYFSDPCHLTEAGRRAFVENVLQTIRRAGFGGR